MTDVDLFIKFFEICFEKEKKEKKKNLLSHNLNFY